MRIIVLVLVLFLVSCIPLENDATRMVPKQGEQRIELETGNGSGERVVAEAETPKVVGPSGIFHEISIKDLAFTPSDLNVGVGDEVTWTNNDDVKHSVVMGDVVSPLITQGGSFTFSFLEKGTFAYSCGIHPSMTGTIVVS